MFFGLEGVGVSMSFAFWIILVLLCLTSCSNTQKSPPKSEHNASPDEVAQNELNAIRTGAQWTILGLGSPQEANKATLGKPMWVYMAKANEISKYSGGKISNIVHATDDMVFPVLVDGKGRLLIEVGSRGGKWLNIRDGYQDSAASLISCGEYRYVAAASGVCPQAENLPTTSIFVELPSLNESDLLLTMRPQPSAPGGSASSIPVPDLDSVTKVVQLNGTPLVPKNIHPVHLPPGTEWVMHSHRIYGLTKESYPSGPGAAPTNPAEDFFKSVAPAAKRATAEADHGPA
jgi:hypothetical protein